MKYEIRRSADGSSWTLFTPETQNPKSMTFLRTEDPILVEEFEAASYDEAKVHYEQVMATYHEEN